VTLNLLFLTQTYPRFEEDVAGPFIRDLARALVAGGDRVTVLAPHAAGLAAEWREPSGLVVRTFRYAPERWERLGYGRSLRADEAMRGAALVVAPLYALAARRAVRRALAAEAFDLVHAHWIVPNAVALSRLPVPLAIGLHGSDVFLAERRAFRPAVRRALGGAALLTGCSGELVERVCALGFPREAARVIPYGVDAARFTPDGESGDWRQRFGIGASAPVLLAVGRMVTKKGFQVLAEALPEVLRRIPAAHVILAGDGDLRDGLEAATRPMRERVHFPGAVLRDALPALYRAADVFALPAMHDARGNVDGLPNVILEAMASGLPVVATKVSGIPLAVRSEQEGLLVAEGDPAALGEAIVTLLGDRDRAQALGRAARDRVEAELQWETIAGRYRAAYHRVVGRGLAPSPRQERDRHPLGGQER
jgi:glycosyltransferase involved in cell wall biosynthesis